MTDNSTQYGWTSTFKENIVHTFVKNTKDTRKKEKDEEESSDYLMKEKIMDYYDMFPQDPNKETVTEEMHPEKAWFAEAGKMTENELQDFFARMIHGYNHDYGTACHAVAACALAAAWAACRDNDIGLSSFQAGFVMWDFIKNWTKTGNECGLRLIDYDDMLYPQYKEKFEKTICKDNWESIQKKAKENLEKCTTAHPEVVNHWRKIAEGIVPFGYHIVDR